MGQERDGRSRSTRRSDVKSRLCLGLVCEALREDALPPVAEVVIERHRDRFV